MPEPMNVAINREIYRMSLEEWMKIIKNINKYKTYPDWQRRIIEGMINIKPSKEFGEFVMEQVNAYVFEKREPPKQIAPAIMNIADDYLNNREVVIRSGDYLSLQSYRRDMKSSV